ncbi:hypothetical protein RJ639_045497 [Escallonia herrerae]|uniref:Uncharacterized protein n=1 Tax=Escallonia herrerae TaxID=1293975 RepID=A0AA88W7P2_9ASTE|nr:hypothetical protein RJ639_045497 [Escallonia herrerae]
MGKVSVMIYGGLASIIFCGYIPYDTDILIKRYSYDEYIWFAVALYLDIFNLFLSLLTILRAAERQEGWGNEFKWTGQRDSGRLLEMYVKLYNHLLRTAVLVPPAKITSCFTLIRCGFQSFLFTSIFAYIAAAVALHLLLLLFRRHPPVPLGPVPAAHSLAMSLVSATIFVGLLFSAAAEIRDTQWFWRRSKTPLYWLLCFPFGMRPSGRVFFWSYAFYLSSSSTPSAHSSPSHDAVPSPSLNSSTTHLPAKHDALAGLKYGATFHRIEGRTVSPSIQGATFPTSSTGTVLPDSCLNDARQSLSRPLSYDPEQRFSRLQRDGLVSRREKSITQFQEESQPLRRNISSSGIEKMGSGKNWDEVESTGILKIGHSMSSDKASSAKAALKLLQPSLEDEDITHQTIPKSPHGVLIIFTLVVYMNGWKEVTAVQFVASFAHHRLENVQYRPRYASARKPPRTDDACDIPKKLFTAFADVEKGRCIT